MKKVFKAFTVPFVSSSLSGSLAFDYFWLHRSFPMQFAVEPLLK